MEEASSSRDGHLVAAPFVLKTYSMVNDPNTDYMISWTRDNNSFVVIDPFAFSRTLLPANFKHNNFSSFVRQLNTYGFRKVDPDRWEFAHACFLKAQNHLLCRIARRRSNPTMATLSKKQKEEEQDEARIALEVMKLKQEQSAIDDEVQSIWTRVQEAEKKPKQMLEFLFRVAEDPEFAYRLLARSDHIKEEEGEKRARHWLENVENGITPMAESVDGGIGAMSPLAGLDCQDFLVDDEDAAIVGAGIEVAAAAASDGEGGYCYMNPIEDVF